MIQMAHRKIGSSLIRLGAVYRRLEVKLHSR
jgi:hypothetical protein